MNLNKLFNIKGKIIILTGGSGFLGNCYSRFFKKAGATVVNLDLKSKRPANILDEKNVKEVIAEIVRKYKKIDILINNASLNIHIEKKSIQKNQQLDYFAPVEEYPLIVYKKGLEVDLVGSFILSKTVLPYMKKQGHGVIINISSVYGLVSPDQRIYKGIKNPHNPQRDIIKPIYYSVSKAGMWGLTTFLASYAAPSIRVNQLTLGGIHNNESKNFVKRYSSRTMLGRMGEAKDIYGALLFLTTDASSYMTGTNIILDGGLTAW